MRVRGLKLVIVVVLVAACVLAWVGSVHASPWSDLPDSLIASYGLTVDQVAQLSYGFGSGKWLPTQSIDREQFVRMATIAFDIPSVTPMVPTYKDVSADSDYFGYIEGATSAGLIKGVGGGLFAPTSPLTRQQAAAIIARQLAAVNGYDLNSLYSTSTINAILSRFKDGSSVSAGLRLYVAFCVDRGLMHGDTTGHLTPNGKITRIQSAALLVRAAAPTITAITPASGSVGGGTTVTISGMGFVGVWQIGAVRFGLTDALSFTVDSATQITAIAPAGTPGTSVWVSVSDASGTVTAGSPQPFAYGDGRPVVVSVDPGSGPAAGGNTVIINGSLFLGATSVHFGTAAASTFTIVSATQIRATAPPGVDASTVDVVVSGPGGTSAVSAGDEYTYGPPVITSLTPAAGPANGGNTVVIAGLGIYGATAVLFGTQPAAGMTLNSAGLITVVAPPGAESTTVDVHVVGPGGSSLATAVSRYTYGAPLVTSVTPGQGQASGYTSVVIRGVGFTGLTGASAVRFGAKNALSYTVVSDTYLTAVAPPGTAGSTVAVTVTNPAGTSPATALFLYYGG
jgi:hypothetical protein